MGGIPRNEFKGRGPLPGLWSPFLWALFLLGPLELVTPGEAAGAPVPGAPGGKGGGPQRQSPPPSPSDSAAAAAADGSGSTGEGPQGRNAEVREQVLRSTRSLLDVWQATPLTVPLEVNVVLLGLGGDGGYRYALDAEGLARLLRASCYTHRPACLDSGEHLMLRHRVFFNVIKADAGQLLAVERALRQELAKGARQLRSNPLEYLVEASQLEPAFDSLYATLFPPPAGAGNETDSASGNKSSANENGRGGGAGGADPEAAQAAAAQRRQAAIFVCNFDKVRLDPSSPEPGPLPVAPLDRFQLQGQEGDYAYLYSYHGAGHAQTWLSHARYLVVDLSAGPATYGPLWCTEGAVGPASLPRIRPYAIPAGSSTGGASQGAAGVHQGASGGGRHRVNGGALGSEYLLGALSSVLVSATEHLLSPDIRFESADTSHRVVVAVIVLSNHRLFNPLAPNHSHSLDLHALDAQVKGMVGPGQEVVLLGGVHMLHEHERLAMALEAAIEHRSEAAPHLPGGAQAARPQLRSVLDPVLLLEEFRESADLLASGLMEAANPELMSTLWPTEDEAATTAQAEGVGASEDGGVVRRKVGAGSKGEEEEVEVRVLRSEQREQKRRRAARRRSTVMPLRRNWDAHLPDERFKTRARRAVDARLARAAHGTRLLPVFVLSLADQDPSLILEGESLYHAAPDAVLVLQTASNHSIPLSFVSGGAQVRLELGRAVQRAVVAGVAAVLGGLSAPFEDLVVRRRSVLRHDWLWAVGHHPFGPLSNTSSLSLLLRDVMLMNGVYSRVDAALRTVRMSVERIDEFAAAHLVPTSSAQQAKQRAGTGGAGEASEAGAGSGAGAKEQDLGSRERERMLHDWLQDHQHASAADEAQDRGLSRAAGQLLDAIYGDPKRSAAATIGAVAHSTVKNLLHGLTDFEAQMYALSMDLYEHKLKSAHQLSASLLSFSHSFHIHVEDSLREAKEQLRCCSKVHRPLTQSKPWFLFGCLVVFGFALYFVIIFFSGSARR